KVHVNAITTKGLREVAQSEVLVRAGDLAAEMALPFPPTLVVQDIAPPVITKAEVNFGTDVLNPHPQIVMTVQNLLLEEPKFRGASTLGMNLSDLYVTLEIGGRDTFGPDGTATLVGGRDIRIHGDELQLDSQGHLLARIPAGAMVGSAYITVTRPMDAPTNGKLQRQEYTSNPAQVIPLGRYAFVANGGNDTISAIDTAHVQTFVDGNNSTSQKLSPIEVARIPLGVGLLTPPTHLAPRKLAVTPDGTRVYATLDGANRIAVIDAVALQEVDVKPDETALPTDSPQETARKQATHGLQEIELPTGARPFQAVIDAAGKRLYVTDSVAGMVYVVDVDPFSPKFHQLVQRISLGSDMWGEAIAPLGLRGAAISADGQRLYVLAPVRTLFGAYSGEQGRIATIYLQPPTGSGYKEGPVFDSRLPNAVIKTAGPEPYDITATDDPNVLLFVDRSADKNGFGVLRRVVPSKGQEYVTTQYIDLTTFGMIPRLVEGRSTQAFGVSNAQGVTFVPANTYSAFLKDDTHPNGGAPHPSYAFITGYNKFSPEDPKHDPALAPYLAYNPTFTQEVTQFVMVWQPTPDNPSQDGFWRHQEVKVQKAVTVPVGAGGNVGIIRNPLGSFGNLIDRPRIVAATDPVMAGFPDNLAVSPLTNLIITPYQAKNMVAAYDAVQIVGSIEHEVVAQKQPLAKWSQWEENPAIPDELSLLLRGKYSTIPINSLNRAIDIAGDFHFFQDTDGGIGYGVSTKGPTGETPNAFAPLTVGRLPRGVAVQPASTGDIVSLQPTPYNVQPSFEAFPNEPLQLPSGVQSTVEAQTGLLRVIDLANLRSVLAVQTEDLAIRRGRGFELLGRAPGAEPRGCSLAAA
ncbi:MAG TPA: YncE family protein, partial [Pirellulaceae bacterium]|nr:YncE family protein [Pirellulaceae bacterium]